MLKRIIYSIEGKVSSTKVGILIVTIATALITSGALDSYDTILKIIAILGAAITGNGIRDAISKIGNEVKNAIDKVYEKEVTK